MKLLFHESVALELLLLSIHDPNYATQNKINVFYINGFVQEGVQALVASQLIYLHVLLFYLKFK